MHQFLPAVVPAQCRRRQHPGLWGREVSQNAAGAATTRTRPPTRAARC